MRNMFPVFGANLEKATKNSKDRISPSGGRGAVLYDWWKIALAVLALVFLRQIMGSVLPRKQPKARIDHYSLKAPFMSANEREFFSQITEIIGSNYLIFPQVRLADIIDVPDSRTHRASFNKICAKSVDFLVCQQNLQPVFVIEINDRTHLRSDRRERDRFVAAALEHVGLPLITFTARHSYSQESIRLTLVNAGVLPSFACPRCGAN